MHLSIRTTLVAALLAGAAVLFACETYKKAPGEEGAATPAKVDDSAGASGDTPAGGAAAEAGGAAAEAGGAAAEPAGKLEKKVVKGATCAQVADHVIEVAMKQPNIPPEQVERMRQLADRQRQVVTMTCENTPWPPEFRDCLASAASGEDIQACRKFEPKP